MPTNQPAQLRLKTPGDVAQLVPFLIGFTPENSLVAIVVQDSRIQVTARVDLDAVEPPDEAEALLDRLTDRYPDADLHLITYTDDPELSQAMLDRCAEHLPFLTVGLAMRVAGNTYWLPDGGHGTIDPYGSISAEATYHGLGRLASRADLEARFASAPETHELLRHAGHVMDNLPPTADPDRMIARTLQLLDRHLPGTSEELEPGTVTRDRIELALLVQDPHARDAALLSITRDNAPDHAELWRQVVTSVPEVGASTPAYLAGMAAWASGDGASACIALDKAQATAQRPDQLRETEVLARIIDQVVPPTAWEQLRADALDRTEPCIRDAVAHTAVPDEAPWEIVTPPQRRRPEQEPGRPPAPGIAI
ncbi:MAG: DUF4192 domain-containing protein [Propionibacteriaceae bacterium]|nr:DUF4192 domain-containing protein [Propionibacteriaceae bacterium]